jgi:hypothetical protein
MGYSHNYANNVFLNELVGVIIIMPCLCWFLTVRSSSTIVLVGFWLLVVVGGCVL